MNARRITAFIWYQPTDPSHASSHAKNTSFSVLMAASPNTIPNHDNPSKPFTLVTIANTIKLNSTNYLSWKTYIQPLINGHNLSGYIDGSIPSPPPTVLVDGCPSPNPAYADWFRQDQLLLGALVGTLEPALISLVTSTKTSKALWDKLDETYNKISRGHIQQKKEQLKQIRKGNNSISTYMTAIKMCADELALLGKPMDHDDLIDRILEGLDTAYQPLIEAINSRDTTISFEELHKKLITKELQLQQ